MRHLATAEDARHADPGLPTWRRLLYEKADRVAAFERHWLPEILRRNPQAVLEIGCGMGYASALMKEANPGAQIVATDVSVRYLLRHTRACGAFLGGLANAYVAADAQALPFVDQTFDLVWSQLVLYRLAEPGRAVEEAFRVLRPGGAYLAVERATPWLLRGQDRREMATRNARHGTLERPWTWWAWWHWAGCHAGRCEIGPGRRIRARWLRWLFNSVCPLHVVLRWEKRMRHNDYRAH